MSSREPILSSNRSSSDGEGADAEEALLTGRVVKRDQGVRGFWGRWKDPMILAYSTLVTVAVIILATLYVKLTAEHDRSDLLSSKRNLIFMVSDGMGPTSLSMTRSFRQFTDGLPINDILTLDKHFVGSSRTRSSNSLVTDSAAGATAFSCALKSYNGAISVLPDGSPCGTILEAAKAAGYMTGLVVTTKITDATPACFSSHVNMRWEEDRIAEMQIGDYPLGRVVDIMLGGGRCHFLPNTTAGSCRQDGRDLIKEAKKNGWSYISDRKQFDNLKKGANVKLPLMGLLADVDIPYDLDRDNDVYPSLAEMAEVALKALSDATSKREKGFFVMIEGSRIDHAGHGNDPAAQVREVLSYDKAFKSVLNFLDKSTTEGVVVSTSDHETGGLATSRQLSATYPDYVWYPSVLANASASSEKMSALLTAYKGKKKADVTAYIRDTLLPMLQIVDATDAEVDNLFKTKINSAYVWADMVSRRAQIGWSTHGHSAVDVNIYAHPPEVAKKLWGNHENTEVGDFLRDYLDVDVAAVTKKLREEGVGHQSWMGKTLETLLEEENKGMGVGAPVGEEVTTEGNDHYRGVHKRCIHH